MGSALIKAIILILSINTLLFLGGVRVIADDNNTFMNLFIDVNEFDDSGQLIVSDDLQTTLPIGAEEGIFSKTFEFVDALRVVFDFAIFLINLVFTPFGLFMSSGLPPTIGLIFGLPLMVIGVISLATFWRSG